MTAVSQITGKISEYNAKSLEQNISKLSGMPEHVQLIPCGREEFGRKNSCIRYVVLEQ